MPARSLLAKLCEALAAAPVRESDAGQIAALHRLCTREQDSQVMRDTWSESQGPLRQAPDVLLAYYSNAIGERLFASLE